MGTKLHQDQAAEREATDIGARFMHSSDVVGDMSRAYGRDLSAVRIHTDESAARGAAERGVDAFSTGKDVFFARGAFDRSDPASRGLLAHELSHSMQQGVGGGAPALTQSAPMGAEQGGLLDWFKRLFGKSENRQLAEGGENSSLSNQEIRQDEPDNPDAGAQAEPVVPAQQPLADQEARQDEIDNADAAAVYDPQTKLVGLAQRLVDSSKSDHESDFDSISSVFRSLNAVNRILSGSFSSQPKDNLQMLAQAQTSFRMLLEDCKDFLAGDPFSGNASRRIVMQIRALAEKDLFGLGDAISDFCAMPAEEQAGQTWSSVLGKARSIRLSVKDYSKMNAATGGAVSEVYKLNSSNTSVRNSDGSTTTLDGMQFFKPEDSIDASSPNGAVEFHSYYVALNETLKKFPGLPPQDVETLKDFVQKRTTGYSIDPNSLRPNISQEGQEAFDNFLQWQERNSTAIDNLLVPSGTLSQGGSINTTRRNVATSRMASLLGVGHLVAKSQTAEIYDETTGQTHRGNIMAAAQGKEYKALKEEFRADASRRKGDASNFTAGFQRDMTSLQVLDVLCGQSDRHVNNMFYKTDGNGKLSGIQGIDNDASFGLNTDVLYTKDTNRSDRRVYDPESGEMVLPYMDAALAERIQSLDGEVVRYALQDLLTEREISAAIRRLEMMKTAIAKARAAEEADPNAPHRFLNDDEWTDETARHMMEEDNRLFEEFNPRIGWNPDIHPDQQKVLTDMLRYVYHALCDPDPEKAAQALLNKLVKDRTPEEKRIFRLAQNAAMENFDRNRIKRTRANGSYFGAFASTH